MGKDIYEKIVKIILRDIIEKKFHEFRDGEDYMKNIVFHDADESVLRHMCDCADRVVGFDKDYSELRGIRFKRVAGENYGRRVGDYAVSVRYMISLVTKATRTSLQEVV